LKNIKKHIISHSQLGVLSCAEETHIVEEFHVSYKYVESSALELNILPARYQKNRNILSTRDQLLLLKSHIVVIGCGKLGNNIIEQMAFLGVGKITVFDPDNYQEKKLNGEAMQDARMQGIPKIDLAHARIREINPAVEIIPIPLVFRKNIRLKDLQNVNVIIDTVDSIQTRIDLAGVCCEIGVPSINGRIENWFGYVTRQMPDYPIIKISYKGSESFANCGITKTVNNLSNMPRIIACFQLAEVCRIVLGKKLWKDKQRLFIDTQLTEIENITL